MSYYTLVALSDLLLLIIYCALFATGIYYWFSSAKSIVIKLMILACSASLLLVTLLALFNPTAIPIWTVLRVNYSSIEFPMSIIFLLSMIPPLAGLYYLFTYTKTSKHRTLFWVLGAGMILLLIGIAFYLNYINIR